MSKNTRIGLGIALGIILLAGVWFALRPAKQVGPRAPVPITVRLKWLHQAQFAGFYVADQKGLYRNANLNVSLLPGGVDFPAVQLVASGSEQFGVTGADQLLLAREKGLPLVALAVIYRRSPMVLFSLRERGIRSPQDFAGRRVGVKLGGNEELTYRALVRRVGVDSSRITEIPVKYDMTPLFTGAVDVWPGYAINEPIVAQERGHPVQLIWPSDYGINLYADALFTTEAFLRENPETVRKFVEATVQGWEYALLHPDEAVTYTLIYDEKLTRSHERAMMDASIPLVRPDSAPVGSMEASRWEEMQRLLLENGFMKRPVDLAGVYTTDFLPKK